MQAYLAAAQTAEGVVAEAGLDEADSERVGSVLTNLVDALAPARWRSSAKRCATASPPCGDAADRANENRARRKVSSDDDYSSRLHVGGKPPLPAAKRRELNHRGEKLRSGSAEAAAALSRQGRYKDVAGNLKVKEVRIADGERFVICFNPEAAERDAAIRARMITQVEEAIRDSGQLSAGKRAELRGVISTKPGLNRYLRVTPGGLLRTDAAKAKGEENLDGRYLLRTADPKLSAEEIAVGYKQLLEVERGWRDMKQVIDLRPVYHRREDRIRAHVLLCWLALLLARIAENACGDAWPNLRRELDRIRVGTFTGPAGTFRQRTEITKPQLAILKALEIGAPPRIYQLKPSVEA
jgi:hypothetical protein